MAYIDREQCLLQSRVTEGELVVLGQDVPLCAGTDAKLLFLGKMCPCAKIGVN